MIEERLLDRVSYGFQFGPRFNTRIKDLANKSERRNRGWDDFRWEGSAPYDRLRPGDFRELLFAFIACGAMHESFRFRNYMDYVVTGEDQGEAPDGATPIQLVRRYTFGPSVHIKTVRKPVAGTVVVYQDGVIKAGSVDVTTGIFTPSTAWAEGAAITADFEFDIPVRFNTDYLPFTAEEWEANSTEVPIIEVFGE